ncbi:MAG: hypothetical protein RR651_12940, partial [Lysinibacillus sp.]
MEQLIFMAIIALVGSLFSKSKNKQESNQTPPFNPSEPIQPSFEEQRPKRPAMSMQSFEDFAKDFLGENKKEQTHWEVAEEPVSQSYVEVIEQKPTDVTPQAEFDKRASTRTLSDRSSLGRMAAGKENEITSNNGFKVPKS